jgi:hypothetical protein
MAFQRVLLACERDIDKLLGIEELVEHVREIATRKKL